jgi:Flp pilus assembly protein TadG
MNSDRGSVTAFVVGMVTAMLMLVGLVHDGGRLIAAHLRAADHAAGAARTGAQELTGLRTGTEQLDVEAAALRARQFLVSLGVTGTVATTPTSITVTVSTAVPMDILAVVGPSVRQVSSTRTAVVVRR